MLDVCAGSASHCRGGVGSLPSSRCVASVRRRCKPCRRHVCQYSTLDKPLDSDPSTSGPGLRAEDRRSAAGSKQQQARAVLERLYHASSSFWASQHSSPLADPKQQGLLLVSVGPDEGLFRVSLDENPETTKSADYYANVGDAIRALRDDVPHLFQRELDFSLYRDDIVFRDPRNTFEGIKNYKLIFWSLRFHGRLFFSKLSVEVKRIWQPEDGTIRMRWTVYGVPRVPWEAEGIFDGVSQYKLDSAGKIYEHAVDNVILRDPPMQGIGPLFAGLNLLPQPQQTPCPGAWFQDHGEAAAAASSSASSSTSSNWSAAAAAAAAGCSPEGAEHFPGALLATVALQAVLQPHQEQHLAASGHE